MLDENQHSVSSPLQDRLLRMKSFLVVFTYSHKGFYVLKSHVFFLVKLGCTRKHVSLCTNVLTFNAKPVHFLD